MSAEDVRAVEAILRLMQMDLAEDQLYGLIGRMCRAPGAVAELTAGMNEIEGKSPVTGRNTT